MKDEDLIKTSRKYDLYPGSIKCQVFHLMDKGHTRSEVQWLLRKTGASKQTIRKYTWQWHSINEQKARYVPSDYPWVMHRSALCSYPSPTS